MTIDDNDNGVQRNVDGAVISRNGIIVSLPPLEYKSTLIGGQRKTLIAIPKPSYRVSTENGERDKAIARAYAIIIKTNPEINAGANVRYFR